MIPTLWIDAASSLTSPALVLGFSGDGATESTATIRTAVSSTPTTSLLWPDHPAHRRDPGFPGPGPDGQPAVIDASWAPPPFLAPPPSGLDPPGVEDPWGA